MPKLGMEPKRRTALVDAAIAEIGAARSLDVTVSQIARRAGMSSALAHHYFGAKDQMFLAAMRRILSDFGQEVRGALRSAGPDRVTAILRSSFAPSCFTPGTINAWMTFYVLARTNDDARRLWMIYQRRMRSNLTHALRGRSAQPDADAGLLVALVDGLYLRAALDEGYDPKEAERALLNGLARLTGDA